MSIPIPVDQRGRLVSFRPTPASDIVFGEVTNVVLESGVDPRFPKGSKEYKNGLRMLHPKMTVTLPDDRKFTMRCDRAGIEEYQIVAHNQHDDGW